MPPWAGQGRRLWWSLDSGDCTISGRGDSPTKSDHVAATQGDGLGYDVRSFDETGRDRFIEVKTTAWGKQTPFCTVRPEVSKGFLYKGPSIPQGER